MGRIQNKLGFGIVGALLLVVIASLAGGVFAGPLDPPRGPGSTQETQITSLPYTISTSGSYILTGNLTGAGGSNGITITADNVTIDLRGFALIGPGGAGTEIGVTGTNRNGIAIQHGIVSGWAGDGISLNQSLPGLYDNELADLRVDHGGSNAGSFPLGWGIMLQGGRVADCSVTASGSASGGGLQVFGGNVNNCDAYSNTGTGILATGAVTSSKASQNTVSDFAIFGGTLTDCEVDGVYSGGSPTTSDIGITLRGGIVSHCSVRNTGSDGIKILSPSGYSNIVEFNSIANTGGNGINITASARIDSNDVSQNHLFGILNSSSSQSTIVRNSANSNAGGNYSVAGSTSGDTTNPLGTIPSSPWANINY
jgi:hypothetical protein